MDIKEKFASGKDGNKYRRIDSEYRVNIFLGYNDDGQMSMVVTENGKSRPVTSTKLINVVLKRRKDGKLALSFDLLDNTYTTMFLAFCNDMITACEEAGSSAAIITAIERWNYWKEMFSKKKGEMLTKAEIKGLIGELIQLKFFFIPQYGENKAFNSWMGPLLGHKDFEIDNTWYEVKSVNENAIQVNISSLEQLDSASIGHLIVCKLEETSTVNENSIDLNSLILSIYAMINDSIISELFSSRLDSAGYTFDEEYNNYRFLYLGATYYRVGKDFPCLRRSEVPIAIGNADYSLILSSISEFREEM